MGRQQLVKANLTEKKENSFNIRYSSNLRISYLEKNIKANLKNYYGDDNMKKLLELLDLVVGEKVVSSTF